MLYFKEEIGISRNFKFKFFDRLKAFKILAKCENDLMLLEELKKEASNLLITFERPVKRLNSSYIFTVPDCKYPQVVSLLERFKIFNYEVFNPKLGDDEVHLQRFNIINPFDPLIVTKKYLSHNETNNYIEQIAKLIREANPNVSVQIKDEGLSFEHRTIKSVTVSYKGRQGNPVVFIDAGSHAREWHSRSMALYFLKKLIDEAILNSRGIIFTTTFVILPNLNDDGYEYSRKGDKLWRKTRRPVSQGCIGVDINRNYDTHFYEGNRERYPCSETYRGPKPFSEPETQVVRNIMARLKDTCKMYIALHTFGNTIIYPWGYTTTKHPRQPLLHKVAKSGVDAVAATTGGVFTADQSGTRCFFIS